MWKYKMDKEIRKIIKEFKEGGEEALDGDETERLVKIIHAKIDLTEGNITQEEYDKRLG